MTTAFATPYWLDTEITDGTTNTTIHRGLWRVRYWHLCILIIWGQRDRQVLPWKPPVQGICPRQNRHHVCVLRPGLSQSDRYNISFVESKCPMTVHRKWWHHSKSYLSTLMSFISPIDIFSPGGGCIPCHPSTLLVKFWAIHTKMTRSYTRVILVYQANISHLPNIPCTMGRYGLAGTLAVSPESLVWDLFQIFGNSEVNFPLEKLRT